MPRKANMAQHFDTSHTILRRRQVEAQTGYSRSTVYLRIAQGLLPRPIALGPRAVGWPASEVAALNVARIAGKSEAELRCIVKRLMTARKAERSRHE